MSTQIIEVPLSRIEPSPTNPRKYFNQQKLEELADSIYAVGIIQAVTLRKHPTKKDYYELVCGERRYRASKLASRETIPAQVKELSDEQVQELQFIENIEREDVHPMDEAVTFSAMLSNKAHPWTLEDIAAKINKPVSFVVQRLQLMKLIPALQKHFWDGKFLIGHAILFARLTEADQKECMKNYSIFRNGEYQSVKKVESFIEENILRKLSAAPFKKDDTTLVPEAGACSSCPKRSGCNLALFADIKADDRCFDAACFEKKKATWLVREVEKVLVEKPEVLLLHYGYGDAKVPAAVAKLAEKYKVHIMNYATSEVQNYSGIGYTKHRALWVSGDKACKYEYVYRKTAVGSAKKSAQASVPAVQVEKIEERLERGKELDFEKEQKQITDLLRKKLEEQPVLTNPLNAEASTLFLNFFLFDKLKWSSELPELLNLQNEDEQDDEDPTVLFTRLKNLPHIHAVSLLVENLMMDYGNRYTKSSASSIIRLLARELGIDVDAIEAAQAAIRDKREANAQKRIHALKVEAGEGLKKKAGKAKTEKQRA